MYSELYKISIEKYRNLILKVVNEILNGHTKVEYFSDKMQKHEKMVATALFVEYLELGVIRTFNSYETVYNTETNTLYVNSDDNIEYIEYVLIRGILENALNEIKHPIMKGKVLIMYEVLYKRGLIKYYSDKLLNGCDHIMVSNLTKLFIESNK